jgi:hypothetical protein
MSNGPFKAYHQKLEITGMLEITRRSDGAAIGSIEINSENLPPIYTAKRYRQKSGVIVDKREGSDFNVLMDWIADNPNIPDPTVDPDVVRLQKDLIMRIVKRVPGGGVVAVPYDEEVGRFWRAYRDGEICGDLTEYTRNDATEWGVTSILSAIGKSYITTASTRPWRTSPMPPSAPLRRRTSA